MALQICFQPRDLLRPRPWWLGMIGQVGEAAWRYYPVYSRNQVANLEKPQGLI